MGEWTEAPITGHTWMDGRMGGRADGRTDGLSKLPVGCCCDNTAVNHLKYVDDIVLFAPSAKGLQRIIDVSYTYGCDND